MRSWQPAGQALLAGGATAPGARPRGPGPRPWTAASRSRSARRWARSLLTGCRSSCAAAWPRRLRTSRGGTASPSSGPFSTAATNRSPPCSAQVTSGARVRPLRHQLPAPDAVGVHEVEPVVLDAREQRACPRARRRCSSPCAGRSAPAAARRRPATRRSPRSPRRARPRGRRGSACPRRCRARACRRRGDGRSPRDRVRRRRPAMHAANAPTPGTTRPSASCAA